MDGQLSKGVVHVNDYLAVRRNGFRRAMPAIQADLNDKLAYTFVTRTTSDSESHDGVPSCKDGRQWLMWQTAMDQAIAAARADRTNLIEVRYGLPSGPHYYVRHNYVPR